MAPQKSFKIQRHRINLVLVQSQGGVQRPHNQPPGITEVQTAVNV